VEQQKSTTIQRGEPYTVATETFASDLLHNQSSKMYREPYRDKMTAIDTSVKKLVKFFLEKHYPQVKAMKKVDDFPDYSEIFIVSSQTLAQNEIDRLRGNLKNATEDFEKVDAGFRQGKIPYTDHITAEVNYAIALLKYNNRVIEYWPMIKGETVDKDGWWLDRYKNSQKIRDHFSNILANCSLHADDHDKEPAIYQAALISITGLAENVNVNANLENASDYTKSTWVANAELALKMFQEAKSTAPDNEAIQCFLQKKINFVTERLQEELKQKLKNLEKSSPSDR
jgi:hypothetical protein